MIKKEEQKEVSPEEKQSRMQGAFNREYPKVKKIRSRDTESLNVALEKFEEMKKKYSRFMSNDQSEKLANSVEIIENRLKRILEKN